MPDQDDNKIIVVGLPPGLKSDDLSKLCAPSGKVLNANVVVDASGAERGFGFVRFASAPEMQAAIAALDKTDLRGRTLNVRAVEKRDAPGGSRSAAIEEAAAVLRLCARAVRQGRQLPVGPPLVVGRRRRRQAVAAARWQQTRGGGGAGGGARAVLADIPDDYCRRYQLGTCHRGGACRWKHEIWRGAEAAAKAEAEAGEESPAVCPPAPRAAAAKVCTAAGDGERAGVAGARRRAGRHARRAAAAAAAAGGRVARGAPRPPGGRGRPRRREEPRRDLARVGRMLKRQS